MLPVDGGAVRVTNHDGGRAAAPSTISVAVTSTTHAPALEPALERVDVGAAKTQIALVAIVGRDGRAAPPRVLATRLVGPVDSVTVSA